MNSVLYVTTTFPTLAAFIEGEVARLRARGVRVRVATLRPVGREYQPEHAALLPLVTRIGAPADARAWAALAAWLVRRPHVLVPAAARVLWASRRSPYALAGHLAYLPAAARAAALVEREGLERVHGAWAHFPATVAWLAARLTGRPFSMAAHAGADLYRTQAFLADKVRAATFVTACVRANAEMLRRLAGGGAVHGLHHGVDLARFGAIARAPAPAPELLVVGRLAPAKGFDDAIAALAELARRGLAARLVVVGDGPECGRLAAQSRALGVAASVEFRGALTHAELAPAYARAWALLAPSKVMANGRRDGIPNVVIEAMAAGLAVVGTRGTGIEEAVVPGETGALAPAGDPRALADALEPLLRAPGECERLGAGARRAAHAGFDAEANFERLWALFQGAAAGEARGCA
ncbi:MAG TPA: glycosyltransferase [Candidatus Eisenbacteria bacterium]|nr:glycosyltransferase [Candidatus Eisenbacteria bacterium]